MNLPEKPRYSTPCNHCGECCKTALCPIGEIAVPGAVAPCPLLTIVYNRALCGYVMAEAAAGVEPVVSRKLGIGCGCSMADEDTTDEQMDRFNAASFIKVYGYARPWA